MKILINSIMFIIFLSFTATGVAKDSVQAGAKETKTQHAMLGNQKPIVIAKAQYCYKYKNSESVRCTSNE